MNIYSDKEMFKATVAVIRWSLSAQTLRGPLKISARLTSKDTVRRREATSKVRVNIAHGFYTALKTWSAKPKDKRLSSEASLAAHEFVNLYVARSAQDTLVHCKEGDYWIIIDRTWNGTPTAQWMGSRTKHKFRNVPSRKLQGHLSGMDLIVSECPCRYQNCVSDFCRTITLFLENEWKCASREHQTPQSDKYQSKEPTNHNHYYFCIISSWQCPNIPAAIPATKNIILGSSSPHQMAKY